jgi:hypothetical protein
MLLDCSVLLHRFADELLDQERLMIIFVSGHLSTQD